MEKSLKVSDSKIGELDSEKNSLHAELQEAKKDAGMDGIIAAVASRNFHAQIHAVSNGSNPPWSRQNFVILLRS